jgi:hypothetical protein
MFLEIWRGLRGCDLAAGRQMRCWEAKQALDLDA